jgi:hypothetical protein
MKVVDLVDKSGILAYLETDRLYAAYTIGDLKPALFAHCAWFGAERDGQDGRLWALTLHYGGLGFPVVFLMGDADGLWTIFEDALYIEQAYFTCCLEQHGTQNHSYTLPEFVARFRAHFDDEGALDTLL